MLRKKGIKQVGKIEYDVYADGKKIGTASREQTTFEKVLDDAASESRHREASLNLIAESAERLAMQYSSLGSGGYDLAELERDDVRRAKWELKNNNEKIKKNIVSMIFYVAVVLSCFIFGGSETSVLFLIAAVIVRFIVAEVWQRISYPIIFFVSGHIAIRIFETADVGSVWVITGICLSAIDFLFMLVLAAKKYLNIEALEKDLKEKEEILKKAEKREAERKKQKNEYTINGVTYQSNPYVVPPVDTKQIVEDLIDKGMF